MIGLGCSSLVMWKRTIEGGRSLIVTHDRQDLGKRKKPVVCWICCKYSSIWNMYIMIFVTWNPSSFKYVRASFSMLLFN